MKKIKAKTNKVVHERKPLEGFGVNADKLESEAERQLVLMQEYSELSAEATFQCLRLENRKKKIRSELILKNQNVAKNQQVAEAMYRVAPDYIAVNVQLAEATYDKERLQNAIYLLAQRRDIIEFFNRRHMATLQNFDHVPVRPKIKR